MSKQLLELAIDVHGGPERWRATNEIAVRLSTGGLAFASRLRRPLHNVHARVSTTTPHTLEPFERGRADRVELHPVNAFSSSNCS